MNMIMIDGRIRDIDVLFFGSLPPPHFSGTMNKIYLDHNLYYIENFINKEDTEKIKSIIYNINDWINSGNFYITETEEISEILKKYKESLEDIINTEKSSIVFNTKIHKMSQSLNEWAMNPHWDKNYSGSSKNLLHDTPSNLFISHGYILYLNDDFEGGEVVYTLKDIRLKPKPGMLLVHPSTEEYTHGVSKIIKGDRYTITGFAYDKKFLMQVMV